MVEHVVHSFTRCPARLEITNVALDHSELCRQGQGFGERIVEIRTMTSREIVNSNNCLTERQKLREEIGADEAGNPRNEPGLGRRRQMFAKKLIRCGDHELAVEVYPPGRFRAVVRGSTAARSFAPHVAAVLGNATRHLPFPARALVRHV